jgi:hypothetical protein
LPDSVVCGSGIETLPHFQYVVSEVQAPICFSIYKFSNMPLYILFICDS